MPLQTPKFAFYGLTALLVAVSIACLVSAFQWINKPFAGFLVYGEPYVGTFSRRDWPGPQAGLRAMDRIVQVDGHPIAKGEDVVNAVKGKAAGTPNNFLIKTKGELRTITLPTAVFTLGDFFFIFFITSLGGILLFSLGFVVYFLKPNTTTSWVFFLLCLSLAIYMITGFDILSSYKLWNLHLLALSFFPAFFFHLGLIFPERKGLLARFPRLEQVIYLPSVLLAFWFQVCIITLPGGGFPCSLWWVPEWKTLTLLARILSLVSALTLVGCLIHSFFKASSAQARQRARMVLFGVGVAFVPTGVNQALSSYGMPSIAWNFLVFVIILFPASIAYSIVRHNLFDADAIIKRTVGYVVVTAIVVGAYSVVSVGFNVFVGQYQLAQSRAFPIVFTLGVILIFNPLRDRIQALVDRIFFRKEYDYGAIIDKIGDAVTSLMDLGQILKRLTQTFVEDMFINTSSIMLFSPAVAKYQVYLADGERKGEVAGLAIEQSHPVISIIEREKRELTKYDVMEDPKYQSVSGPCARNFEDLHASLMVPLVFQDRVIGLLGLGEKKSGKSYNRQDIDLLHAIANQGAVAIENARLFQENLEKQRMEEELAIARDLQMSMLPPSCPQIRGFEIAALSIPAREVGGDFYDFIDMGQDRVGLVIGDVTGKSVSGALVMSASRSVFRMLSEDALDVGEIMMRANRRTKKDIKTGMFVALLYAVLDAKERTISMCSAGQTQPLFFSSKTGKATLVETKGDKFPLGILEDSEYVETRLQLFPGDRIIFYTDGMVEAMNEQGEIFGFERLIEAVQDAHSLSAESLLRTVLERIDAFSGNASQHDDLTAIVLSVVE